MNARANRRLIKIGWTSQDLDKYLRSKAISHDPILLGSRGGSWHDEQAEHLRFRMYLADGREWYFPRPALLDAIQREYDTTEDFDTIRDEMLSSS